MSGEDTVAFRLRHAPGVMVGGEGERDKRARRIIVLDPFAAAFHRGRFEPVQYSAGEKFRLHWERGGMRAFVSSINLDMVSGSADHCYAPRLEDQVHHVRQFRAAETEMGRTTAAVCRWVICEGQTLEAAGLALGWNEKNRAIAATVERMRCGLDALVALWGLQLDFRRR